MVKKKAAKASSRGGRKNKKDKNRRRKTKPQFLICPETDEKIWITSATLQDIKEAAKKKRHPFSNRRQYLVTVPSPATRQAVYRQAARALEDLETRILPEYGGRPWKCVVKISDGSTQGPYFCFMDKGQLELAAWPHIVEKIPDPPRWPGYSSGYSSSARAKASTSNDDDDDEDEEEDEEPEPETPEQKRMYQLQERPASVVSQAAFEDRWRVPLPTVTTKWISPLHEIFNTRKSAWDHAVQLCRNEVLLDKVLEGYGANGRPVKITKPSQKAALHAGKLRFERDGLWVVGQEEAWQIERLRAQGLLPENDTTATSTTLVDAKPQADVEESPPKRQRRGLTGLNYFIECTRAKHRDARLREIRAANSVVEEVEYPSGETAASIGATAKDELESSKKPTVNETKSFQQPKNGSSKSDSKSSSTLGKPNSFTLRDAEKELRIKWRETLSDSERQEWMERARKAQAEIDAAAKDAPSVLATPGRVTPPGSKSSNNSGHAVVTPSESIKPVKRVAASGIEDPTESEHGSGVDAATKGDCAIVSPSPPPTNLELTKFSGMGVASGSADKSKKSDSKPAAAAVTTKRPLQPKKLFTASTLWRLQPEQIKLCYEAGMEHYNQVMVTVKARDLSRELQDGFDLLRERGRGRFDMELPAFDTPRFAFLSDLKKAPWMPIVRKILGKDVVLIHKGMFLSLPGAAPQEYHQDGPHLTEQYQRPCHAINVFVPLVDLTSQNGPTEFCLGSHILGQEDLDKDFLEVPKVPAGTPVIFDYRLGHRGLGNTSGSCRPILYCTYTSAADGKEFRDSVNFSRRRYHRLGDLVSKLPSRDERKRKREQMIEEQQVEVAIEETSSL